MPKVKWGLSSGEPDELEDFEVYDGPDLRNGVYQGKVTRLSIKGPNRNGDDMITGLWLADDPDKPQFRGAPLWFQQNISDQGKPYIRKLMEAMGLSYSDFENATVPEVKRRC
jgi:hypothetical protein